jgi:hypothetical protein
VAVTDERGLTVTLSAALLFPDTNSGVVIVRSAEQFGAT